MQFRGFDDEVQLFPEYEGVTNIQLIAVYDLSSKLIPVQRYNIDRQVGLATRNDDMRE